MDTQNLEAEFHVSFYIIVYKFILGLFELLLGLGIIFLGNQIIDLYQNFKTQELLEDPHDILVTLSEKLLPYFLEHKGYIVLILIILGIVKIFGAIGLLYKKHWGLDLLVGLTILVLPFELYTLIAHPSVFKLLFVIINTLIALYLVKFQPKNYFYQFKKRVSNNY